MSHIFRPIVQQTPGQPDPTSQDALDLAPRPGVPLAVGHDALGRAYAASKPGGLPDFNATGPCQAQAHWSCTGEARGEHLHPLSMLPGSKIPADYIPMCLECKEHLGDQYIARLHGRAS